MCHIESRSHPKSQLRVLTVVSPDGSETKECGMDSISVAFVCFDNFANIFSRMNKRFSLLRQRNQMCVFRNLKLEIQQIKAALLITHATRRGNSTLAYRLPLLLVRQKQTFHEPQGASPSQPNRPPDKKKTLRDRTSFTARMMMMMMMCLFFLSKCEEIVAALHWFLRRWHTHDRLPDQHNMPRS